MKTVIASDHAGFNYKGILVEHLKNLNFQIEDIGAFDQSPSDYPDFANAVSLFIQQGKADRGIIICGSGVGVSIAANKFKGIRSGVCHDHYSAHQCVEHDDVNVLCIGERVIGIEVAKEICEAFLNAVFSGEERHIRRLEKINAIENNNMK